MKSDTTDILNEADDMERRLSWILFKQEQEGVLYGGDEDEWSPGDPVYLPPELMPAYREQPTMYEMMAYGHTQLYFNPPRCEPCETYWKGPEPCFICGEVRELGFEFYPGHGSAAVRVRFGVDAEGFSQSMARAMEAFVGDFHHSFAEAGRAINGAMLTTNETRRLLGLGDATIPEVRSNHDSAAAFDLADYPRRDADAACAIYRQSSIIENWDQIFPPDVPITTYPTYIISSNSIQLPENLDLEAPVAVPMPVIDVFSMSSIGEMSRLIERRHAEDRRSRAIDRPVTERRRDYGG